MLPTFIAMRTIVVGANCVRPSNVVRSLTAILELKRVDQSRQRRGRLAAAWRRAKEKSPARGVQLGIPPSTLESKIKQLGIRKRQFSTAS
jgi:hypothetical protein